MDMIQHRAEGDSAAVFSCGNEGGNRFGEIKGIDFVKAKVAVLQRVKEFRIGTSP